MNPIKTVSGSIKKLKLPLLLGAVIMGGYFNYTYFQELFIEYSGKKVEKQQQTPSNFVLRTFQNMKKANSIEEMVAILKWNCKNVEKNMLYPQERWEKIIDCSVSRPKMNKKLWKESYNTKLTAQINFYNQYQSGLRSTLAYFIVWMNLKAKEEKKLKKEAIEDLKTISKILNYRPSKCRKLAMKQNNDVYVGAQNNGLDLQESYYLECMQATQGQARKLMRSLQVINGIHYYSAAI